MGRFDHRACKKTLLVLYWVMFLYKCFHHKFTILIDPHASMPPCSSLADPYGSDVYVLYYPSKSRSFRIWYIRWHLARSIGLGYSIEHPKGIPVTGLMTTTIHIFFFAGTMTPTDLRRQHGRRAGHARLFIGSTFLHFIAYSTSSTSISIRVCAYTHLNLTSSKWHKQKKYSKCALLRRLSLDVPGKT